MGEGDGICVSVGDGEGSGVSVGDCVGVSDGEGDGVSVGVGEGVSVGVALGADSFAASNCPALDWMTRLWLIEANNNRGPKHTER